MTEMDLHRRFAQDLESVLEQQLADPDRSFIAQTHHWAQSVRYYDWFDDVEGFEVQRLDTPEQPAGFMRLIDKRYRQYCGRTAYEVISGDAEQAIADHQQVLETARQSLLVERRWNVRLEDDRDNLLLAMFVGATLKPSDHAMPNPGNTVFWEALRTLESYSRQFLPAGERHLPTRIDESTAQHLHFISTIARQNPRVRDEIITASGIKSLKLYALHMLNYLGDPGLNSDDVKRQVELWQPYMQASQHHAATVAGVKPLITFIEVGEMLSPDLGSRPDMADRQPSMALEAEEPTDKETARIALLNWLGGIATRWGGTDTARIAAVDMQHTGSHDYYAAILTDPVAGVEHAVAANPLSNNAVFLYRGEQGVVEGEIVQTWQDIFPGNKKNDAKALGARRMVHTANLDERIEDVLTRDPSSITDPRYFL